MRAVFHAYDLAMRPGLTTILREWGRIGCLGFGGPPAHIALLRTLCVERRRWLDAADFEHAIAACNLLPGPASTQLAIYCGWRVRGRAGAIVGGLAFIVPGLIAILVLASLFLAEAPPRWILAAGAGAGAAVAAVAVQAGWSLLAPRWRGDRHRSRTVAYLLAGGAAAVVVGPWLVVVLIACGLAEVGVRRLSPPLAALGLSTGGSIAWVAFKVGALSYGGGFVIVPMMQADAVHRHHWMTAQQFLDAVALGQVTPGPVVHTVAAVGYAAGGVAGGLLAAVVAFTPSFAFILAGGRRFDELRGDPRARAFLDGAAPAAIGAILGSAIPLARAIQEPWQAAILAGAAGLLLVARRGVVETLLVAALAGVAVSLAGGAIPG
jgi:chromate transporter